jgi:hypothetical protein
MPPFVLLIEKVPSTTGQSAPVAVRAALRFRAAAEPPFPRAVAGRSVRERTGRRRAFVPRPRHGERCRRGGPGDDHPRPRASFQIRTPTRAAIPGSCRRPVCQRHACGRRCASRASLTPGLLSPDRGMRVRPACADPTTRERVRCGPGLDAVLPLSTAPRPCIESRFCRLACPTSRRTRRGEI